MTPSSQITVSGATTGNGIVELGDATLLNYGFIVSFMKLLERHASRPQPRNARVGLTVAVFVSADCLPTPLGVEPPGFFLTGAWLSDMLAMRYLRGRGRFGCAPWAGIFSGRVLPGYIKRSWGAWKGRSYESTGSCCLDVGRCRPDGFQGVRRRVGHHAAHGQ